MLARTSKNSKKYPEQPVSGAAKKIITFNEPATTRQYASYRESSNRSGYKLRNREYMKKQGICNGWLYGHPGFGENKSCLKTPNLFTKHLFYMITLIIRYQSSLYILSAHNLTTYIINTY